MENIKSLNEEVDEIIEKKLSVCDCSPCTCSEQKKNIYFRKLKNILATYNSFVATFKEEYLGAYSRQFRRESY